MKKGENRMKRRILPLLLAFVIMLGMIPAGFAQDTEEGAEQHSYEAPVFTGIETGRAYCSLPAFALSGAESERRRKCFCI